MAGPVSPCRRRRTALTADPWEFGESSGLGRWADMEALEAPAFAPFDADVCAARAFGWWGDDLPATILARFLHAG